MTSRPIDIAAVGDNCLDRLTGRAQSTLVGGNALNVAAQAARSGLSGAYFGAVGPEGEPEGDLVARALRELGVDLSHLARRTAPTSVTLIEVAPNGDRRILHEDFGACVGYRPDEAAVERLLAARHVHIGWLDDGGALRRTLADAGRSVSQDVSVNASPGNLGVEGLTLAFRSLPEERADEAEAAARDLVERGARGAAVTLGARGSLALVDGRIETAEAPAVEVVDTTGAGDSYIAGFLAARLAGAGVAEAMAAGHRLAAETCRHLGGFPQHQLGDENAL